MFALANKKIVNRLIIFVVMIVLGLVFVSPQLQVKVLTPLDFDETLDWGSDSTSFLNAIDNAVNEPGRFIPIRYMNRYFQYNLFGYNSRPYYLMNGIELGLILFLAYLIIAPSGELGFIFFLTIIAFLPQLTDGFYRIGTAEPILIILVLAATFFLNTGKYIPFLIAFIFMLLAKENSFFIAPIFIVLSFNKFKQDKVKLIALYVPYLICSILIIRSYAEAGYDRYFAQYIFSVANFLKYLGEYVNNDWPTFLFLILSSFLLIYLKYIKKRKTNIFLLLLLVAIGWVSLFPLMLLYESYYILPSLVISVLAFVESLRLMKFSLYKNLGIYSLVFVVMFLFQFPKTITLYWYWHIKQVGDAALTTYLLNEKENVNNTNYFLLNQSLQNINGSWLILSDFGKSKVNFKPSASLAMSLYQRHGEEGINKLFNETIDQFSKESGGVSIENPCQQNISLKSNVVPICGESMFLANPVCNWCVVSK